MKRGAPRHPKVTSLADRLSVELYAAVGLLELLWHFTAEYAPSGDVGRHSDRAIARALHWKKKPDVLIDGLLECRWLDRDGEECLVVHDWPAHADDATHMKLARARLHFSDGSAPNFRRLPTTERALAEQFYANSVRTVLTRDAHLGSLPNGEGQGLGQGNGGEGLADADVSRRVSSAAYRDLIELWQKPCDCCGMQFSMRDEILGGRVWFSLVDQGVITAANIPEIMAGLTRYRASKDWHKKSGEYVPSVSSWLGWSKSGIPAEPKWRDYPAAHAAKTASEY